MYKLKSFIVLMLACFAMGTAYAESPTPAKPMANPMTPKAAATPIKPVLNAATPGTQTEDDVYVGVKRQAQGVNTPGAVLQIKPTATTSPNSGNNAARKNARTGGDEDLEELEVERRTVDGINKPGMGAPQIKPGAGTSPNTSRSTGKP